MIIILDRTSDTILDEVPSQDILENRHRKSLKDTVETFEFQTYADRDYSPHLVVNSGLIIPDDDGKYIEFVIHEVVKTRDSFGALILHIYASASFLELTKAKHIPKHTSAAETNVRHVEIALEGTSWAPGVVTYAGIRTIEFNHSNPISYLKRVATEFGLEIQFRVEVAYNRVIGRYVDLIERIGQWRGKEVVFGKDLLGVKRTENSEEVYTALYGYGPEDDNGNQISVFVEDLNALERWSTNGKHLVGYYEPQSEDSEMTAGTLRTLTENELEKRINSVITYEISFVDLEYVENFDHEIVRFGDTIRVIDRKFNPPLFVEARIHTIERDIIDEANKVANLGDFVEYTEDEVTALWRMIRLRIQITKEAAMSYTDAAIGGVQQDLSNLSSYIDGAFEDSIVSQAEAKAIEKYLNSVNAEKADLDARYNEIYANSNLTGTTKTNLASAKTDYNTAHTNLINSINTAIADGETTTTEKADVDSKFSSYRTALSTLAQRFDKAIDAIAEAKAAAAQFGAKVYTDGVDTQLRTDLRATAPLPTSITLNTDGITATTSDPTQYARLDYRGLFVNKGAIQVQRADGYNTIIDGYMNFNYNVQPAYPPFLHPEVEYYSNNIYRTNYTGGHRNLGFFSFRHEARYLKIRVATYMSNNTSTYSGGLIVYDEGGQGTLASHLFTNQGSASVPSGGTLLTVDLGVPTGNDRAVYIQFKSSSSTVYAYARVLRMWLEG